MDLQAFVALILFGEKIVEIIKPWFQPLLDLIVKLTKQPDDRYVTMIFSALCIGGLAFASGANMLADVVPSEWLGRAITIIAAAGGSGVLHDALSSLANARGE